MNRLHDAVNDSPEVVFLSWVSFYHIYNENIIIPNILYESKKERKGKWQTSIPWYTDHSQRTRKNYNELYFDLEC